MCESSQNSIIFTLAIVAHGKVIETNLSPGAQRSLENVRLFSKSGDFQPAYSNMMIENNILRPLKDRFQINLLNPQTTLDIIKRYETDLKVKYQNFLLFSSTISSVFSQPEESDVNPERVCQTYPRVNIDKVFAVERGSLSSIYGRVCKYLLPGVNGIYLVSVHYINPEGDLINVYPEKGRSPNILNLGEFRKVVEELNLGTTLPNMESIVETTRYPIKLSSDKTAIEQISMSRLCQIIKEISGKNECFINLMDYSCSGLSKDIPQENLSSAQYHQEGDIERGFTGSRPFGGKKKRRSSFYSTKSKSKRSTKREKKIRMKKHRKRRTRKIISY
jgi:hypothetical protein